MRLHRHDIDPLEAALAVSWFTVVWSALTGAGSAVVGVLSGNVSLAGLGVTVLIDMGASAVLVWRFRHERLGGAAARPERIAHRVASIALVGFGAVLTVQAIRSLVGHADPETSIPGLALAAASLVVLPMLARRKYDVASRVGSAALRADAHITAVGAAMAGITLVGLALNWMFGWSWTDGAAALILATVTARQGIRGLRGN